MANTFVKLPSGDIEIEHIREMVSDLKETELKYSRWFARPALIDKKSGTTHLFHGQNYDRRYFDLDHEGWTHDHCTICFVVISEQESEYVKHDGYYNGWDWICKECYEILFLTDNLKSTLQQLYKYEK